MWGVGRVRLDSWMLREKGDAGEFPAQMASNEENVSIWWRHHSFFVLV